MPVDGVPKHLVRKLSRAKFDQFTDNLVKATIEPCKAALKDAGLKASDIDEVILVGGSTRMPSFKKLLRISLEKILQKELILMKLLLLVQLFRVVFLQVKLKMYFFLMLLLFHWVLKQWVVL